MTGTQVPQEIRPMRFEEACGGWRDLGRDSDEGCPDP